MPTAEILSQGDEVVTGQIADTNAAWLSERLTDLGFQVMRHTSVGDRQGDLVSVFREISTRCDLCVCTGGLGPTDDDLTAGAVAEAFDRPLALDPIALAQLEERFRQFGRPMAPVNRRQAHLPQDAERLDNDWGTAPGFAFVAGQALFACMPGVPREMREIFTHRVVPLLHRRFALRPGRLVTLRTVGVGESDLQQALRGTADTGGTTGTTGSPSEWAPAGVIVGFRTRMPENHLKLRFPPELESSVSEHVRSVLERIGRWVYTIEGLPEPVSGYDCEGGTPAAVVGRLLAARGETLAVAESCTGGRIAAECTAISGASAWFLEGVVTYANSAKVRLLGVSEDALTLHGAVSEVVARAMARGVRTRSGASWGIAVTGIAGPSGGTPEKPVGTVHVAVDGEVRSSTSSVQSVSLHRALRLPGDRERIQIITVAAALELLRRHLATSSTQEPA